MPNTKKNRIVQLDPTQFREFDGVVFDLESFARHCTPHHTETSPQKCSVLPQPACPTPQSTFHVQTVFQPPVQQAVFQYEPVHIGWYPVETKGASYPIMANANLMFSISSGSGSSSYLTSFLTSWQTRWTSYLTSGSFYSSYFSSFTSSSFSGGYGLELI